MPPKYHSRICLCIVSLLKTNPHQINGEITANEVRLVGDNVQIGIYTIQKALEKSNDLELDLVLMYYIINEAS